MMNSWMTRCRKLNGSPGARLRNYGLIGTEGEMGNDGNVGNLEWVAEIVRYAQA
jgi:hypothetical protein